MQMAEEVDFEVRLENLPGSKGVRLACKMPREHVVQIGDFFLRLSGDQVQSGVSLLFKTDGEVTFETF
jgi:hypothetical protein